MSKNLRSKLDGVSIEELVKITRVLTRTVNTGRVALIAALRVFCKAAESTEINKMARTPGSKDGAGKGRGMPGGGGRNRNPNPCPKGGPGRGKGGGRGGGRNR